MSAEHPRATKRLLGALFLSGFLVAALVLVEPRVRPALLGPDRRSGHTEIYVSDSASVADGVVPGETVTVHVVNHTGGAESYEWSLNFDGTPTRSGTLSLGPGEASLLTLEMPTELRSTLLSEACRTWVHAKSNDSWTRLAARHELGLAALLSLNGATVDTFIGVGDRICVAAFSAQGVPRSAGQASAKACGTRVRADVNDSWTRLAVRYELGLAALLSLNGATVDTFIGVGDRICVGPPLAVSKDGVSAEFVLAGKAQALRWKVKGS